MAAITFEALNLPYEGVWRTDNTVLNDPKNGIFCECINRHTHQRVLFFKDANHYVFDEENAWFDAQTGKSVNIPKPKVVSITSSLPLDSSKHPTIPQSSNIQRNGSSTPIKPIIKTPNIKKTKKRVLFADNDSLSSESESDSESEDEDTSDEEDTPRIPQSKPSMTAPRSKTTVITIRAQRSVRQTPGHLYDAVNVDSQYLPYNTLPNYKVYSDKEIEAMTETIATVPKRTNNRKTKKKDTNNVSPRKISKLTDIQIMEIYHSLNSSYPFVPCLISDRPGQPPVQMYDKNNHPIFFFLFPNVVNGLIRFKFSFGRWEEFQDSESHEDPREQRSESTKVMEDMLVAANYEKPKYTEYGSGLRFAEQVYPILNTGKVAPINKVVPLPSRERSTKGCLKDLPQNYQVQELPKQPQPKRKNNSTSNNNNVKKPHSISKVDESPVIPASNQITPSTKVIVTNEIEDNFDNDNIEPEDQEALLKIVNVLEEHKNRNIITVDSTFDDNDF